VVVGSVVRRNRIRGAGEDGVHVVGKAGDTRLKRNHAFGTRDDGLDVKSQTTRRPRNKGAAQRRPRHRGRAGGDRRRWEWASGNGDPRQCTNIVCR
jgi:hypothetical protein